mmetsp:Transcript_67368/g.156407  ORF Transcript_67368/g.156407 Transcript_67368/m.156407 type:complete len:135 (-) Transcript_67368:13-417(-)
MAAEVDVEPPFSSRLYEELSPFTTSWRSSRTGYAGSSGACAPEPTVPSFLRPAEPSSPQAAELFRIKRVAATLEVSRGQERRFQGAGASACGDAHEQEDAAQSARRSQLHNQAAEPSSPQAGKLFRMKRIAAGS